MTRDETRNILMLIQAAYPNYHPQDKTVTIDLWTEMLSDYNYEQVSMALKAFISTDTNGFPPSIGQIISKIHSINTSVDLNEMEAWSLVSRALRNGYYNAEYEFNKLPSEVKKAIGSPSQLRNWAVTNEDSIENVIQSNFIRTYRSVLMKKQENARLPREIQLLISKIEKRTMLERESNVQAIEQHYQFQPTSIHAKAVFDEVKVHQDLEKLELDFLCQ